MVKLIELIIIIKKTHEVTYDTMSVEIMNELNWDTPLWINFTRFVMDTTIGKVRYENIKNGKKIALLFQEKARKSSIMI